MYFAEFKKSEILVNWPETDGKVLSLINIKERAVINYTNAPSKMSLSQGHAFYLTTLCTPA